MLDADSGILKVTYLASFAQCDPESWIDVNFYPHETESIKRSCNTA